jgi:hypothetical protein
VYRRRQVMNVEKNLPTFISQLIHLWQNFEYSPLGTRMQKHKNKPKTTAGYASHIKKYMEFSWVVFFVSKTSDNNKKTTEEKIKDVFNGKWSFENVDEVLITLVKLKQHIESSSDCNNIATRSLFKIY